MKNLVVFVLGAFLSVNAHAQTTILRFEGIGNSSKGKNYIIDIGGRKFYSSHAPLQGAHGIRSIEIRYLSPGSHNITVYEVDNDNSEYNRQVEPIYQNTFRLKDDCKMVIAISSRGKIAFSEKPNPQGTSYAIATTSEKQPLSRDQYNKLFSAMKDQFFETDRYSILNNALEESTNYFTIFQITQLLSLISSESDRLALAKKGFTHLLPEANTLALLEVFTAEDNREDLRKYLQSVSGQSQ